MVREAAAMHRALVIEDELKLLHSLEQGLRAEGYEVTTAATGEEGGRLAAAEPFDCLVLDLLLPGRDGLQILADLRRRGNKLPVLILTARDAVEDRIIGLDAGADDYLVKPFALAELLARLRVLLRRGQAERPTLLRADDLEVDLIERRARRTGVEIALTQREFEVLSYLVRHKNAIVTRDMLGREVWKEPNHALTNVIDVYITLLRRKLEQPGRRSLIHTVRGVGYILRDEPCD
jgi:two-component system, OmpR family, copper resistance phosphate regulon response regulator CusR